MQSRLMHSKNLQFSEKNKPKIHALDLEIVTNWGSGSVAKATHKPKKLSLSNDHTTPALEGRIRVAPWPAILAYVVNSKLVRKILSQKTN